MATIKSVFGGYSDELQTVVDTSLSKFAPVWYPNYFELAPKQINLTYTSVLGSTTIDAAATIISRDSAAPLRSRDSIAKLYGEIPAISEKYAMSSADYRNFLTIQSLPLSDKAKKDQLLNLLFGDVKKVGNAAHKKVDMMALEAVSTGKITIDVNNNPDGYVSSVPIDLGMDSGNKVNAAVNWATSATATPITDIQTMVELAEASGKSFAKILLSRALWLKFAACKQVTDSLTSFNQLQKGAAVATLDRVNAYLEAMQLPPIEIVNQQIGVEKDGVKTATKPFSQTNAVFVPSGPLGKIHTSFAQEELTPVSGVSYADYNGALISKWSDNDPFAEYTKVEFNAFPGFESINNVYLLSTTLAF